MNALVHDAQEMLFASHDTGLQRQMIERLVAVGPALVARKQQAVDDGDEPMANLVLGYQCVFGWPSCSAASRRAAANIWLRRRQARLSAGVRRSETPI